MAQRNPADFVKASQSDVDKRVRELTKPKEKRLDFDAFQAKHKQALAQLTGEENDEAQAERYREELNKEREQKLQQVRKQKEAQKPGAAAKDKEKKDKKKEQKERKRKKEDKKSSKKSKHAKRVRFVAAVACSSLC